MNYADIKLFDIANGPGVRVTLFVSGCRWHCPGCFNQEAWDFNYGKPFNEKTVAYILKCLEPDYVEGITFLGGEPLALENREILADLAKKIKETFPQKTIWCFTGDVWDHVKGYRIMQYIDVLVDGPFIQSLKDMKLRFRGSSNQRLINVQESLEKGKICLYEKV